MNNNTSQEALMSLLQQCKTLQLATLDESGHPAIGYAPFVQDEAGNFYIYVSELASHTHDILRHPWVAVLIMADEQDSRQVFARARVTYQCQAEVIAKESLDYGYQLDAMQVRFGEIMALLRTLSDFMLFKLVPVSGRFVQGFGQAYHLTGEGLRELRHIGADDLKKPD